MHNQIENLKNRRPTRALLTIGVAAFIPLFTPGASAITVGATAEAGVAVNEGANGAAAIQFSPGIADVLKMVDAKVDAGVIKAFVNNSTVAYSLRASEIIALKQRGVGDEIITALIQRGGELRAQAGQGAAPRAAPASAPVYDYGAQPAVYPEYAGGYLYYSYGYPTYAYSSYYDYGYPWAAYWPYYSWPYFGFGFYPFFCGFHHSWGCHHFPFSGHHNFFPHSGGIHAFGPARTGNNFARSFSTQPVRFAGGNMGSHPLGTGPRSFSAPSHAGGFHSMGGGGFHGGGGGFH